MQVRFWGTRGSIATPGPDTVWYGGNTCCVQVHTHAGTLLVLDDGSAVGALCLTDHQPRGFAQSELIAPSDLAALAERELCAGR